MLMVLVNNANKAAKLVMMHLICVISAKMDLKEKADGV